jgi:hypothetical protein
MFLAMCGWLGVAAMWPAAKPLNVAYGLVNFLPLCSGMLPLPLLIARRVKAAWVMVLITVTFFCAMHFR